MTTTDKPPMGVAAYWKLCAGTIDPLRSRWVFELGQGVAAGLAGGRRGGRPRRASTHLNSRVFSIAGGSNEMQRNAIGEKALGLPREPSFDTDKPFGEVVRNARWR